MKNLLRTLLLLLPLIASAQSSLPPCQGSSHAVKWHNCFGAILHGNGDKQVGEFKDGRLNGQGMESMVNGHQYIGTFKDGMPHGHGTETLPEGHKYVGEFREGKYHGEGSFDFANRNRYVGQFIGGWPEGKGTYTYANGKTYVGEFKAGKRNGRGALTFADGEKFVGEFRNDEINGLGIEYRANGTVARSGRWTMGDLAEGFAIDPARFQFLQEAQPVASLTPVRPPPPPQAAEPVASLSAQRPPPSSPASVAANVAADRPSTSESRDKGPAASDVRDSKPVEQVREQAQRQAAATVAQRPAQAAPNLRRIALVIGNDSYQNVSPLVNARADARAMAKALESAGFKVSMRLDLTERGMKEALRNFRMDVQGGDEVVVFFAGHGMQLGAANYLLPVDVRGGSAEQIRDEAIALQTVLDDLSERKPSFSLTVIDACRDSPIKSSSTGRSLGGRGLAPPQAATGQMVIFSAGTGQQALDRLNEKDKNPNGLFTRVFLKEMLKPGLPIDRVVRNVKAEVVQMAKSVGHEQVPATYDQTMGDFFFVR